MFRRGDRRKSDTDLYMKLPDSKSACRRNRSEPSGVVVRTDELKALHGVVSPRRKSVPLDLDAEHFMRTARPVQYTYPDSPENTRLRRGAGIEKEAGSVVGIPGSFQKKGASGETLISEDNLNVCLVACLKHLMGRVEDLEQVVRELRAERDAGWSVQSISRAAGSLMRRSA